jgi:hypothetical protein
MIERFCVGTMDVEHALRIFRGIPRKAVVTGGFRTDIQLAALETDTLALVLTGGVAPHDIILAKAREKGVAVLKVAEDTFSPWRSSSGSWGACGSGSRRRSPAAWKPSARRWTPTRCSPSAGRPRLPDRALFFGFRYLDGSAIVQ